MIAKTLILANFEIKWFNSILKVLNNNANIIKISLAKVKIASLIS